MSPDACATGPRATNGKTAATNASNVRNCWATCELVFIRCGKSTLRAEASRWNRPGSSSAVTRCCDSVACEATRLAEAVAAQQSIQEGAIETGRARRDRHVAAMEVEQCQHVAAFEVIERL